MVQLLCAQLVLVVLVRGMKEHRTQVELNNSQGLDAHSVEGGHVKSSTLQHITGGAITFLLV